uniref:Transport and Golgi organization protein 2 n=1 Tax=Wuchereria bancrofti TaxID=6293 RepID=A0AAF5RVK1_WUCBA
MCVTFVYVEHNPDAKYKLILLNNRDELLNRPTSTARWENGILAGRDEKESIRGTWLCMNATGSISNLLAITVPIHQMKSSSLTLTRGALPVDFVKSNKKPEEFCKLLVNTVNRYNAFQILYVPNVQNFQECFFFNLYKINMHFRNEYDQYEIAGLTYQPDDKIEITRYPPGIHGFSNSPSCEPFKKVQRGTEKVNVIIEEINSEDLSETEIIGRLLQLATDKYQCYPDDQLKRRCGRSSELCKYRAAIFVRYPDGIPYGTRSHTIIIVDRNNRATYYEKSMETGAGKASEATWTERIFHFELI